MKKYFLLAMVLWAAIGSPASSASLEGLRFDDQVRLANRELLLNGLGVRSIFIFRAYVAGLYLEQKTSVGREVVRHAGPKRLQLRMMMDIGAQDIKKALVDGMRKNVTAAQWEGMAERAADFSRTIDSIGITRSGDSISLDYLPDVGLSLAVNDIPRGAPIAGKDFYDALLEIFVGVDPVDTRLRQGLLGQ